MKTLKEFLNGMSETERFMSASKVRIKKAVSFTLTENSSKRMIKVYSTASNLRHKTKKRLSEYGSLFSWNDDPAPISLLI